MEFKFFSHGVRACVIEIASLPSDREKFKQRYVKGIRGASDLQWTWSRAAAGFDEMNEPE
jgi:hypothetical protein